MTCERRRVLRLAMQMLKSKSDKIHISQYRIGSSYILTEGIDDL
jgi:hypothetical protein